MVRSIKIQAMQNRTLFSQKVMIFLLSMTVLACNSACFFINKEVLFEEKEKLFLNFLMLTVSLVTIPALKIIKLFLKTVPARLFFRLLGFEFVLILLKTALFTLFFSPAALGIFFLNALTFSDAPFYAVISCAFFCAAVLVVSALFFGKAMRLLFLSEYCFIEEAKISSAIKKSIFIMEKQTGKLLKLKLSFFGWFALCALIFPIPFVQDYYGKCLCLFAVDLMKE